MENVDKKYHGIFIDIDKMIEKLKPLPNSKTLLNAKTNNHLNSSINTKTVFPLENYTKSLYKS